MWNWLVELMLNILLIVHFIASCFNCWGEEALTAFIILCTDIVPHLCLQGRQAPLSFSPPSSLFQNETFYKLSSSPFGSQPIIRVLQLTKSVLQQELLPLRYSEKHSATLLTGQNKRHDRAMIHSAPCQSMSIFWFSTAFALSVSQIFSSHICIFIAVSYITVVVSINLVLRIK